MTGMPHSHTYHWHQFQVVVCQQKLHPQVFGMYTLLDGEMDCLAAGWNGGLIRCGNIGLTCNKEYSHTQQ